MQIKDIYTQAEWDLEFDKRMWAKLQGMAACGNITEIVLSPKVFDWYEAHMDKNMYAPIRDSSIDDLRAQWAQGYSIWTFRGLRIKNLAHKEN
jgi:hypothetical protein|tara:strand:+ start:45 stop:323 length:279 start_codon:yes stop_codon:yes gene_type:complete